jgi:hypothetical protein
MPQGAPLVALVSRCAPRALERRLPSPSAARVRVRQRPRADLTRRVVFAGHSGRRATAQGSDSPGDGGPSEPDPGPRVRLLSGSGRRRAHVMAKLGWRNLIDHAVALPRRISGIANLWSGSRAYARPDRVGVRWGGAVRRVAELSRRNRASRAESDARAVWHSAPASQRELRGQPPPPQVRRGTRIRFQRLLRSASGVTSRPRRPSRSSRSRRASAAWSA